MTRNDQLFGKRNISFNSQERKRMAITVSMVVLFVVDFVKLVEEMEIPMECFGPLLVIGFIVGVAAGMKAVGLL